MLFSKNSPKFLTNEKLFSTSSLHYHTFITIIFIALFSILAYSANYFLFHLPGNNYFPDGALLGAFLLGLILLGSHLQFEKSSSYLQIIQEISYFFGIM